MAEQDRPIGEVVGQLIDDGKAYAKSEIDLARLRALMFAERYRAAAILAAAAAAVGLAALIALTMTAVLTLAGLLGPLGGGLLATALIAALAAALAYMAKARWDRGDD